MTKKMLAAYLAVVVMFVLTGCQLAREGAGENNSSDRLIGVFITKDYLDLFDMERYIKDNQENIFNGAEIFNDDNSNQYGGRLYGTLLTQMDEETGKTSDVKEIAFEGVEGILYYSANLTPSEDEHSYTQSSSDEEISDGKVNLNKSDDEESTIMEGTIYITPSSSIITFYINPVYQSADGRVYVTSGSGFSLGGVQTESSVYTQTLEESITITENEKSKLTNTLIKISLSVMLPPERIAVVQMDKTSTVLSRTAYTPREMPDTLIPEEGVEYIIVETYKHNLEGDPIVSRSLYDISSQTIETFYCRDDGICLKMQTWVKW